MAEQITELWGEYLESGGEPLPLLKALIDEAWQELTADDTEELRRFLGYGG
ncbi:hypothetical protein AB0D91_48255 [Streptomyces canus]|uniref:hypothetical protein n=1 Tax=Streptomyces canus TaxID=58343 RepID=UPI00340C10F7